MLALMALVLAVDPRFPKGLMPMQLPALPAGLKSWSAQSCAKCHATFADQWQHSGHATARTNFVFQAALKYDEPTWCVRCHAPLAQRADRSVPSLAAPAEERGVTCAACHAGASGVLSTHASEKSPHAIEVDPALASGAQCAECHQFGFAVRDGHGRLVRLSEAAPPQQDTFHEWAESGEPRSCVSCHVKDHTFGGVRRVEALKSAIEVRELDGALELTPRDVGHRLPTGDIMRWLTLELSTDAFFAKPVVAASWGRELGSRQWADGDTYLAVVADHRLAGPERVELPRGIDWAAWRLVLHLVSPEQEQKGLLPAPASRIIVNAGTLTRRTP